MQEYLSHADSELGRHWHDGNYTEEVEENEGCLGECGWFLSKLLLYNQLVDEMCDAAADGNTGLVLQYSRRGIQVKLDTSNRVMGNMLSPLHLAAIYSQSETVGVSLSNRVETVGGWSDPPPPPSPSLYPTVGSRNPARVGR